MDKEKFFIKEIDSDNYLVYNSLNHIPSLLNKEGFNFFNIILKYENIDKCLDHIDKEDFKTFMHFFKTIEKSGLLDLKEHLVDFKETTLIGNGLHLFLHLTYKCNLSCRYCYNKSIRQNQDELTVKQWKLIIDKVINNIGYITLTGGEPTLYNGLLDIVEYIKSKREDVIIDMFTNGMTDFRNKHIYTELFKYIDKITISCDSLTGRDDRLGFSPEILKSNMDWLTEFYNPKNITINSVWNSDNFENIKSVKHFADRNSVGFTFSLQIPNNRTEKENLPDVELYNTCLCNGTFKSENISVSGINEERILTKTIKCGAASSVFSIDNMGNCFPCQVFNGSDYKLGNLLYESFKDIYNSLKAKEIRSHTVYKIEECKICKLKYACGGGCIGDTYKLNKDIYSHPDILCPYYKNGAINNLLSVSYE